MPTKLRVTTMAVLLVPIAMAIGTSWFAYPTAAAVIINELLPDPAAAGDKSEWIELFNTGQEPVDLRGWSLDGKQIDSDQPVTIQPGSFFLLVRSFAEFVQEFGQFENMFELSFSLANSGDEVTLKDEQGYEDVVSYLDSSKQKSLERSGPLCSELIEHPDLHTLNQPNLALDPVCRDSDLPPEKQDFAGKLIITEYMPNPDGSDTGNEWVEIYNAGDNAVLLQDVYLQDSDNARVELDEYDQLGSAEYLQVVFPKSILKNCEDGKCTENITLYYQDQQLDIASYSDSRSGQSWSIDEQGNWTLDYLVTPGSANQPRPVVQTTILISEVYPSPDTSVGETEWIELYNYGDMMISLTDWQISDASSRNALPDWYIGPGQHLVLSNLGISLNNGGDELSLISSAGDTIDQFNYQETDKRSSWIREWNGQQYTLDVILTGWPTAGMVNIVGSITTDAVKVDKPKSAAETNASSQVLGSSQATNASIDPTLPAYQQPHSLLVPTFEPVQTVAESTIAIWPIFAMLSLIPATYLGYQLIKWEGNRLQHVMLRIRDFFILS